MTSDITFLKGTAVLGFSGIIVKILSAVYRIPLTRMIGAEGMGQYSAVFNLFMPFYSFAVAGITPAVSRLCSSGMVKNNADVIQVKRKAGRYFGAVSLGMIAVALTVSRFYAGHIYSPLLFIGVALLCPNLLFATFEAIYKGISQGNMNMAVSAKAGILESRSKIIIGLCSVYLAGALIYRNRDAAQLICAFATVSVCGFICLVYMSANFRKTYYSGEKSTMNITASTLFAMALPISLSALVVSAANFCDTVVCLSIVKKIPDTTLMSAYPFISFTAVEEKAIWLFGVYQGLCLSVTGIIPSLSATIGASGLPLITRAVSSGQVSAARHRTERLLNLAAACVIPVSFFVMFFSYDVVCTLYGDNGARTTLAGCFLKVMAPTAILSAFSFPLNSIIHAMGKSSAVFRIMVVSSMVKIALSVGLCSVGRINIMGCIVSQLVFHTLVFVLSVFTVRKVCQPSKLVNAVFWPAIISYLLCTFIRSAADSVMHSMDIPLRTVMCGGVFVVAYMGIMVLKGIFVDKH